MDHVLRRLEDPLRLEDVAAVAGFSPHHFHRVFQAAAGETLHEFVKRHRLERALRRMAHAPRRPLTEIALECGFASSSDFSRSFKARYGVPPSAFDLDAWSAERRAELQSTVVDPRDPDLLAGLAPGENPDGFEVTLRRIPARTVAYVRTHDPFRGGVAEAAARLVEWARARGVEGGQWLGYMWEQPDLVALADCRYDTGVVVDHVEPEGEGGRYDFPARLVAEVPIRGAIDLEQRALDWLYGTWLPTSGYEPDDQPGIEAWRGLPFGTGFEYFEVDLQLPVRPAFGG